MIMESPLEKKLKLEWPGLPHDLLFTFKKIADKLGMGPIAIVGGAVRDELIRIHNEGVSQKGKDIDLLVEGSATKLSKAISKELGPKRVKNIKQHVQYNTVEMTVDGFSIDLATARLEKYHSPGLNPVVKGSSLLQDLGRRDFSVNAMAIELSEMQLIDPYGGENAIKKKKLKFLHELSVQEDPTRVIRAARYSARLNLNLDDQSIDQIKSTLHKWPWKFREECTPNEVPPALGTRLRLELELLLRNEPWELALKNLKSWGGFLLLDKKLQNDMLWKRRMRRASKLKVEKLTALIIGAGDPNKIAKRLQIPKNQQDLISGYLNLEKYLLTIQRNEAYLIWTSSEWTFAIESGGWEDGSIALYISNGGKFWRQLFKWITRWKSIKSSITAKDLLKQGWQPGPELGKELRRLRALEIDKN